MVRAIAKGVLLALLSACTTDSGGSGGVTAAAPAQKELPASFRARSFLPGGPAAVIGKELNHLVGRVAYVKDGELILGPVYFKTTGTPRTIQILDEKPIYEGLIDDKFTSGVSIAVLNLTAEAQKRKQVTIRDVAKVFVPDETEPDIDTARAAIANNLPKNVPVYYVKGAILSTLDELSFEKKSGSGKAAYTFLNVGGEIYASDSDSVRTSVISLWLLDKNYPSGIPGAPLPPVNSTGLVRDAVLPVGTRITGKTDR